MIKQNNEKEIYLSEIIWRLKEQNLNDYFDSSVSYYHEARKIYIFGFIISSDLKENDLITQDHYKKKIHESAFSYTNSEPYLKLRFRKKVGGRLDLLKEEQKLKYNDYESDNRQTKQKEKTISEVVEKVALWRKLYTGFIDEKNEVVHMDLDTSATEIGIVKKTLDDYLLQIRNGKRYGFNFHKRRQDKIGELRTFVKEHKNADEKHKK
jgi:hypothetical protein